ncbi:hypothetical protein [Gimesia panareensis]|uniref:hypothetical protein n=1 Tax=Gimesia panareensis TaxID=2527978 RepID=UPI0011882F6B|nr:hypothetical protein [Gimesia panareensis]QDU51439.1 hypothetical protein Pan110_38050 [Gimesia panareensis]
MRYLVPLLLLFSMCHGCSSIKTTAFDRLEDDTIVANPDQHLKGIPVSLRVPSHLELTVEEKTFWRVEGSQLIPVSSCRATRTISHDVKYTEKIFLVDPVRPAAGPATPDQGATDESSYYGFSFKTDDLNDGEIQRAYEHSGKGQLTGLNYHIEDKTIIRSAQLLKSSLNMIKAFKTSAKAEQTAFGDNTDKVTGLDVLQTTRVIGWSRFDLNSEHFEEDVMGFLNTYVNQKSCAPDCPGTAVCK